jgi:hypothetical protein
MLLQHLAMYHGSRGKFGEVDTEGFAIAMLREYRRTLLKTLHNPGAASVIES